MDATRPVCRPYFVPVELDFEALPEPVRHGVLEIVVPAYEELVLGARSAQARAAATTVAFNLFLEVVAQYELTQQIAHAVKQRAEEVSPREADVRRYLRTAGSRLQAQSFLLKIEQFFGASKPEPSNPRAAGGDNVA